MPESAPSPPRPGGRRGRSHSTGWPPGSMGLLTRRTATRRQTTVADVVADPDVVHLPVLVEAWRRAVLADRSGRTMASSDMAHQ